MNNKLLNILTFNMLMWQVFSEFSLEFDTEMIGKVNDDYIKEKSLMYLGHEIGWKEFSKVFGKVQTKHGNFLWCFKRKLTKVFDYYTDELKLEISENDNVIIKEGDYGSHLYPHRDQGYKSFHGSKGGYDTKYEEGQQITGIHVLTSNFILEVMNDSESKVLRDEDYKYLLRKYKIEGLLEDDE